jgi:hypothetical protein
MPLQYGKAATAAADALLKPAPRIKSAGIGQGHRGPAQKSNHIDLPLGTGPLDRFCQKGRVTSLHNHDGPLARASASRGAINNLLIPGRKKNFTSD